MKCINKNSMEYQALLKQSGIPDFKLSSICGSFLEKYDRFPYLDEINGANSTPYIQEQLGIKDNGNVEIDNMKKATGTKSVDEAVVVLNNTYRDVEVEVVPITNSAKVTITKRPISRPILGPKIERSQEIQNGLLFSNIIYKLGKLYGIQIHDINNDMLNEFSQIPGVQTAKAFIYNGEIYVNSDLADKDAPIHEMMHIFVGSIKNTKLYQEMIENMINLPEFKHYAQLYYGRTVSDIAEETFVSEFAKLASGNETSLHLLPEKVKYELFYNAKRILDTILMGESSIKTYNTSEVFNSSLLELLDLVNSSVCELKYAGMLETAQVHRMVANKKQELMENKELEEHCEM